MAQEIDNVDDLRKQIEADELQDKLELAALGQAMMSAREYARARGISSPQRVYYYIRNRRISEMPCPCCGRKVINVKEADEVFFGKDKESSDGTADS